MTFAERLTALIDRSGKKDKEIEQDLSLPRSTIYTWKKGKSRSYTKYIEELADYFNVTVEYLLGRENLPAENGNPALLERIKELCEESGRSLDELESALGLNSLATWGKSVPAIDKVEKVADYFNVSVDYLLGRTDNPNMENEYEFIAAVDEDANLIEASPEEMKMIRAFLRTLREEN